MALAWQESHFNPAAINLNQNGTKDYGLMQINTISLPMPGLTPAQVMQPCVNVFAGAYLYKSAMLTFGL